jgi:hypothetical protein
MFNFVPGHLAMLLLGMLGDTTRAHMESMDKLHSVVEQ